MKPKTSTNLDILVLAGSVLITEVLLVVAMALRQRLPFGAPLLPGSEVIPFMLYVIVGAIWFLMQIVFATPRLVRNGQLIEGLWRLVAAIGLSSITLAGALFLSFRVVSRVYFVYFVALDLVALL